MLKFLSALIGGASYAKRPEKAGTTYIKQELKKAGIDPGDFPDNLYAELSAYAYQLAQDMESVMPNEKAVTHFVNNLDYIVGVIFGLLDNETVEVAEPLKDILLRFGFNAKSL